MQRFQKPRDEEGREDGEALLAQHRRSLNEGSQQVLGLEKGERAKEGERRKEGDKPPR